MRMPNRNPVVGFAPCLRGKLLQVYRRLGLERMGGKRQEGRGKGEGGRGKDATVVAKSGANGE